MRTRLTGLALPAVALALGASALLPAWADPGNGQSGDHPDNGKSAQAQDQDPPGNNGTFKVDGTPFDDGKGNEPHVACGFRLKFYGFDEGQRGDITIAGQAPSGSGTVSSKSDVLISDDAAGGGNDADAVVTYTDADLNLAGLTAHPQQGYHLKVTLTTDTPGGVKHKVFWYEPCAEASPTPTPEVSATVTPTPEVSASVTATPSPEITPSATVSATGAVVTPSPSATVLGVKLTKPGTQVRGSVFRRGGLPFTGSPAAMLVGLGAVLVAVGSAATLLARRRRHGTV